MSKRKRNWDQILSISKSKSSQKRENNRNSRRDDNRYLDFLLFFRKFGTVEKPLSATTASMTCFFYTLHLWTNFQKIIRILRKYLLIRKAGSSMIPNTWSPRCRSNKKYSRKALVYRSFTNITNRRAKIKIPLLLSPLGLSPTMWSKKDFTRLASIAISPHQYS